MKRSPRYETIQRSLIFKLPEGCIPKSVIVGDILDRDNDYVKSSTANSPNFLEVVFVRTISGRIIEDISSNITKEQLLRYYDDKTSDDENELIKQFIRTATLHNLDNVSSGIWKSVICFFIGRYKGFINTFVKRKLF